MSRRSMLQQYDRITKQQRYERIFKADTPDDDSEHLLDVIADRIVEAGNGQVSRQDAMHWLLHTPGGSALLVRLKNRKEHPMRIVKSRDDFIALCQRVNAGKVTDLTANELTALYPGDGFAQLCNDRGSDGLTVRKALSLTNPFSLDRKHVSNSSSQIEPEDDDAQAELERLAEERRQQTGESREKAFAKVYEQNKALAQREREQAYHRIGATS
jgi:hypothetical protein